MKFIYVDESGNTGNRVDDPFQPYHLVAGLIIDHQKIISVENEIRAIGLKYCEDAFRKLEFEFHGYEIHKGKGYFKNLHVNTRIELMKRLLGLIKFYELHIAYMVFDKKQSYTAIKQFHPHQTAFMYLVQTIEQYLFNENSYGLLVADENPDIEKRLVAQFEFLKRDEIKHALYNKIEHIVDSIHFVKSNTNHLIQLADIVAFVLLRGIKTEEVLRKRYDEENKLNKAKLLFKDWVENSATLAQKVDLEYFRMVNSKQHVISNSIIKIEDITKDLEKDTNQGLMAEAQ